MFIIIGFFYHIVIKTFQKDSKLTIMLMVIISTFIYEVGIYAFK